MKLWSSLPVFQKNSQPAKIRKIFCIDVIERRALRGPSNDRGLGSGGRGVGIVGISNISKTVDPIRGNEGK